MGTHSWERINPRLFSLSSFPSSSSRLSAVLLEAGDFAAARICGRFLVAAAAVTMRRWRRGRDKGDGAGKKIATDGPKKDGGGDEWKKRLEAYKMEQEEGLPDPRYSQEVEEELMDDGVFEKEGAATPEQIAENEKLIEQFRKSEVARFLLRSQELAKLELQKAKKENANPTRKEDAKLWKSLPYVRGPYGGPDLPRKALNSEDEVQSRFWDFFKQFQFGLWGYRQRPYPPERPIDVQQVLGYKWLDKRYSDCK